MARPFAKLRSLMIENDDTQDDLARLLLIDRSGISSRMNNRSEWKIGEMYAIMNRYHLPHEMLNQVFPMNGKRE